jgi:hypothetical protein
MRSGSACLARPRPFAISPDTPSSKPDTLKSVFENTLYLFVSHAVRGAMKGGLPNRCWRCSRPVEGSSTHAHP